MGELKSRLNWWSGKQPDIDVSDGATAHLIEPNVWLAPDRDQSLERRIHLFRELCDRFKMASLVLQNLPGETRHYFKFKKTKQLEQLAPLGHVEYKRVAPFSRASAAELSGWTANIPGLRINGDPVEQSISTIWQSEALAELHRTLARAASARAEITVDRGNGWTEYFDFDPWAETWDCYKETRVLPSLAPVTAIYTKVIVKSEQSNVPDSVMYNVNIPGLEIDGQQVKPYRGEREEAIEWPRALMRKAEEQNSTVLFHYDNGDVDDFRFNRDANVWVNPARLAKPGVTRNVPPSRNVPR